MKETFRVITDSGNMQVNGAYIPGTRKLLAVTVALEYEALEWAVTHVPSGAKLCVAETRGQAAVLGRGLWMMLRGYKAFFSSDFETAQVACRKAGAALLKKMDTEGKSK